MKYVIHKSVVFGFAYWRDCSSGRQGETELSGHPGEMDGLQQHESSWYSVINSTGHVWKEALTVELCFCDLTEAHDSTTWKCFWPGWALCWQVVEVHCGFDGWLDSLASLGGWRSHEHIPDIWVKSVTANTPILFWSLERRYAKQIKVCVCTWCCLCN